MDQKIYMEWENLMPKATMEVQSMTICFTFSQIKKVQKIQIKVKVKTRSLLILKMKISFLKNWINTIGSSLLSSSLIRKG
jgi:hypothetical protein